MRKQPKTKEDTPIKSLNVIKPSSAVGLPTTKNFKNTVKASMFPHRKYAINMELRNGKHRTFQVTPKNDRFNYEGGTYIIDQALAYDNLDCKLWMLDYHQNFSMPIKRSIPIGEVQRAIEETGGVEVENSTNPATLRRVLEADIGGGIARASAIPEFIKQIKLMVAVGMLSSVILLILFIVKTGMLNSIKNII